MNENIKIIINPTLDMIHGFHSNGIGCGLKNEGFDLGVIFSKTPATTFAVYTTNKILGAHIPVSKKHLKDDTAQMIVVNSKIANTCTGQEGIDNAVKTCQKAAELFNINPEDVLPASTGVIGPQLPIDKITSGLERLHKIFNEKNDNHFTDAIMTTDTKAKIIGLSVIDQFKIFATAKGSGMIAPNMATMLGFICTDAIIKKSLLKKAFSETVEKTFNSITVDGDTSTNDSVIIMSNGQAGNKIIDNENSFEYEQFKEALYFACKSLIKEIVKDGEGATKIIKIIVNNAKNEKNAKELAMTIANSNLVKTACFGEDPNWGRILCAAGYSNVDFDPDKISVSIDGIEVVNQGKGTNFNEEDLKDLLHKEKIKIEIDLNTGDKSWTVWTSDLSYDYIKINASYTT